MANSLTSSPRNRRPVSVDVGVRPVQRQKDEAPPTLCFVGIAPPDWPWLSKLYPRALVRDTRFGDMDAAVEHVRFQARDAVDALPGLECSDPSRLRDSVRVALGAGARTVDVVLARIKGAKPWDLDHPDLVFGIDPFISNMVGTSMVYPDIGGPVGVGFGTEEDLDIRVERFVKTVRAHASRWVERYQIGLLDDPGASGDLGHRVLASCAGVDGALVRWVGEAPMLRKHGWRSSAAIIGGMIAAGEGNVLMPFAGVRAKLTGGRFVKEGRHHILQTDDSWEAKLPDDDYYVNVMPEPSGHALVRSEPTLRSPVGQWSLPSIRVAKVLSWRINQAVSRFVFETADLGRAVALSSAVTRAVQPYVRAGLLTGPEGDGEPQIRGGVIRNPGEVGLRVDIAAQIRPWAHKVNVQVNLRPGGPPVIEEVA